MEAESLQSVANVYFDARAVDEDEDIDEKYSDYSDDSADDCTDSYSNCEFDYSAPDKMERSNLEEFVKNMCECSQGDQGKPCSSTNQDIIDCRNNCFELTSSKLDLVILGTIHTSLNCDKVSHSGRREKHRQQTRMPFYYHNLFQNVFVYASHSPNQILQSCKTLQKQRFIPSCAWQQQASPEHHIQRQHH